MNQITRPLSAGAAATRYDFGALLRDGPPARTAAEAREHVPSAFDRGFNVIVFGT